MMLLLSYCSCCHHTAAAAAIRLLLLSHCSCCHYIVVAAADAVMLPQARRQDKASIGWAVVLVGVFFFCFGQKKRSVIAVMSPPYAALIVGLRSQAATKPQPDNRPLLV